MKRIFKRLMLVAAMAVMLIGRADEGKSPTRLDVTSQPEGASVLIDGQVRGITPLSLFDLTPGGHLVRVSKPGSRNADDYISIAEGEFMQKNYALDTECGLLLVKTEPAGAEVKYNGVSIGNTPLLITEFATGASYSLELSLAGYRSKRIEVKLEDRTPIVRTESLMADSGVVDCQSEPEGATVVINGIERGVTPLTVANVPKGLATVTFRMAGYKEETRELRLQAGESQTLAVTLKAMPTNVRIVTTPENAKVFVDDNYQGKSPVEAVQLMPGQHTIRVELAGYAPQTRTINVEGDGDKTEEFTFESVLGRVEVMTIPPGTKVTVNGRAVGTTKMRASGVSKSEILALEKMEAGEYSFVFSAPRWIETVRKVKVEAKKTAQVNVRLKRQFAPDTEVETIRGVYRGMLVTSSPLGITLETRPGMETFFPQKEIRHITPLDKDNK